jgi:hypothetical protein
MTENCKFRKAILSAFYNILQRNFGILLNFVMLFQAVMKFCLDLLRSKFWLIGGMVHLVGYIFHHIDGIWFRKPKHTNIFIFIHTHVKTHKL